LGCRAGAADARPLALPHSQRVRDRGDRSAKHPLRRGGQRLDALHPGARTGVGYRQGHPQVDLSAGRATPTCCSGASWAARRARRHADRSPGADRGGTRRTVDGGLPPSGIRVDPRSGDADPDRGGTERRRLQPAVPGARAARQSTANRASSAP